MRTLLALFLVVLCAGLVLRRAWLPAVLAGVLAVVVFDPSLLP